MHFHHELRNKLQFISSDVLSVRLKGKPIIDADHLY